jgi:phosphoribosylanthranilate isomerase
MSEEKMKKTMVKICGLRRPEDAMAANYLRPDLAGFILSPGFRRSIDPEQAQMLRRLLSPQVRTVGVFVDAPFDEILQAAEGGWIDMIQLHGEEDEACLRRLSELTDLPIIKAFRIHGKRDLEEAAASSAEWVLLDSGTGTGKTFDWPLLLLATRPYMLAGGLNPDNIGAAVASIHPYGVDTSTGVETDGVKDAAKIRTFIEIVRKDS